MAAPTNSSETKIERKQKYCDVAVKHLNACKQYQRQQHHIVKINQRWQKKYDKYDIAIDKKIAKIRKKYCSSTSP